MAIYIFFWFSFLFMATVALYLNERNRRVILFTSSMFLSVIAGLRYYSANDYQSYTWLFSITPSLLSDTSKFNEVPAEVGFVFINSLFKSIGVESYFFFFILAFISIGIKSFVQSKLSKLSVVSLFIYFSLVFYNSEFIQIRWALALAFSYIAIYYWLKNSAFFSIVSLCIACTIHITSLVFFPIFILAVLAIRYNFVNLVAYFSLLSFSLSFFFDLTSVLKTIPFLNESSYFFIKLKSYLINVEESISWHVNLRYFLTFIIVFFIFRLKCKNPLMEGERSWEINKVLFALFFCSVTFSFMFLSFPIFANRLFIFSDFIFSILLVNYVMGNKGINNRASLLLIVLLLFFLYGVLLQNSMFSKEYLYEYKTWLGVVF